MIRKSMLQDVIDYQKLCDELDVAVLVFDQEKNIKYINKLFAKYTDFSKKEMMGKSIEDLYPYLSFITPDFLLKLSETRAWKGDIYVQNKRKNRCFYLRIKIIEDAKKLSHLYLASLYDVTRQKKSEKIINHLAYFDALTELPNYVYFKQLLEREIEISIYNRQKFALLLIDIDKFKLINDSYGHEFGDYFLKKFAKRLQKYVRSTDIVARRGGDEFHIIIKDVKNLKYVQSFAEELLKIMRGVYKIKNKSIFTTISIGIAYFSTDTNTLDELLKKADEAMYLSKNKGRNIFTVYPN